MMLNGKIDRKALPEPEIDEEEIVPPKNRNQEIILGILKEILEGIPMGITTNFIELGLSSLDTMVLAARLDEQFRMDVKFGDIFENLTAISLEKMLLSKPKRKQKESRDRYLCFLMIASAYQLYTADESVTSRLRNHSEGNDGRLSAG